MTFVINKTALIAGAALLLIQPAAAQSVATQSPQNQPGLGGTAIPGPCLLSREAIFANAKVSVAATARLQSVQIKGQPAFARNRGHAC